MRTKIAKTALVVSLLGSMAMAADQPKAGLQPDWFSAPARGFVSQRPTMNC